VSYIKKKTNEKPTVFLRKGKAFTHITWTYELGFQELHHYKYYALFYDRMLRLKECGSCSKVIRGNIIKG